MTLDQRLTHAARQIADGVVAPQVDLDAVRRGARARRRRTVTGVVTAAVLVVAAASTALTVGRDTSAPVPPASTPTSTAPTQGFLMPPWPALETGPEYWLPYESVRYGFDMGAPPGWGWNPAVRSWTYLDGLDHPSSADDAFLSPDGHVRVSAWSVPLDPGARAASTADLVEWARDYCERTNNSPCAGIAERAVPLCVEKWDYCHPGLLVPFKEDVQAFFGSRLLASDAMTVVAVWRPETSPATARYGGSTRLLEQFLSTMQVWPESTPREQRR